MSGFLNAELLDSINKVLDEVVDRAALQDFANGRGDLESRLWRQAADLGWLGVGLPEEHGGLGLGASGIASLQQALGAHLAPGPYLSSMAGWQTLSECADAGLKANVFSDRGPQAVCVPATPMASHPVGLRLVDGRVSGKMDHVLGSPWSPWALVPVQSASDSMAWALVAIDGERASLTVQPTWDLTRSLCRLSCSGAQATLLQQPFDRVRETLCAYLNLAVGFDCVGGAEALQGETIAYMKGRSQFDRPIASFQALKHRVAKMHIELEMCQQAVSHALAMAEASEPERAMWAAMAKARASDTYAWVAGECVQLHGGVGYTWEFNCHLHLKRARLSQALVGSNEQLLDRAATTLSGPVPDKGSFLEMVPVGAARPPETAQHRSPQGEGSSLSPILQHKDDMPAFRLALREWLARECPSAGEISAMDAASGVDHVAYEQAQRSWMAKLDSVGLATPHWPADYGGAGLSLQHQIVIADEMARANAPRLMMFLISLNHIPATLLAWGTEEQKARYLPGVAKGDVWCQGFSEPSSGSDLASLRTRAVRDGDHYVVNGQKLWSSQAMHAKRCILLARTDPQARKQAGISYFVLDMQTPGLQVRPIRQATGRAEFAEIFLDDVRIPVLDRIGDENRGWEVAQTTLASERGLIVFEDTERMRYQMEAFHRHAQQTSAAWLQDDQLRREFMRFVMRLQSVRRAVSDLLRHNEESPQAPTIAPSVIKVASSCLFQEYASFRTRIAGIAGNHLSPVDPGDADGVPMRDYIETFSNTIAGGSNEIQLNIIAERGLGMPRG